jgi:uncharacterized protein (DUF2384 family)
MASRQPQIARPSKAIPAPRTAADSVLSSSSQHKRRKASAHAMAAAELRAVAEEVWGSAAEATAWLNRPQAQFGGATPESLLHSAEGTHRVAVLLSALDNGFPV